MSSSPPRKLAIVGASRPDASVESLPQFPRRPTHRARHSVDTAGLLPKEQVLRRDSSPDAGPPSPRIVLRRNSTRTGPHRNGVYVPRSDSRSQDSEDRVPFPRTVSAEHAPSLVQDHSRESTPPASSTTSKPGSPGPNDKPRQPRGRFQSEIDGSSSRRKPRPNSYDELGAKPRRSRYESMVNLGVVTSNASASDILTRDPYEGSAVRQTLIVKEDGKPPTQFVCIPKLRRSSPVAHFGISATWKLHRTRSVWGCLSGPEPKHWADGGGEADPARGAQGGGD